MYKNVLWVIGHPRAKSSGRNFVNAANGHRWERIVGHLRDTKKRLKLLHSNLFKEESVYTGKLADLMVMRTGELCQLFHNFQENPTAKKNPMQKRKTQRILSFQS